MSYRFKELIENTLKRAIEELPVPYVHPDDPSGWHLSDSFLLALMCRVAEAVEGTMLDPAEVGKKVGELQMKLTLAENELEEVEKAVQEYPLVPKETFIGRDSIADKVTWLARRAVLLDRPGNSLLRARKVGARLALLLRPLEHLHLTPEGRDVVQSRLEELHKLEAENPWLLDRY